MGMIGSIWALMIGGLLVSTFLTLVFVPIIYKFVEEMKEMMNVKLKKKISFHQNHS